MLRNIHTRDGTETFFGDSESFGFRIIASEALSETRNLTRNPKPQTKPRNCQNINNLFIYSLQSWRRNPFEPNPKFRASDYNFRNLIRNSKPHPNPKPHSNRNLT